MPRNKNLLISLITSRSLALTFCWSQSTFHIGFQRSKPLVKPSSSWKPTIRPLRYHRDFCTFSGRRFIPSAGLAIGGADDGPDRIVPVTLTSPWREATCATGLAIGDNIHGHVFFSTLCVSHRLWAARLAKPPVRILRKRQTWHIDVSQIVPSHYLAFSRTSSYTIRSGTVASWLKSTRSPQNSHCLITGLYYPNGRKGGNVARPIWLNWKGEADSEKYSLIGWERHEMRLREI
jgi:hypothetical protein